MDKVWNLEKWCLQQHELIYFWYAQQLHLCWYITYLRSYNFCVQGSPSHMSTAFSAGNVRLFR